MGIITGKTSLIGVIGDPISHSLSPAMHNAALREMGLNWCYVAMQCNAKNLKAGIRGLRHMNFKGLNITIPHKETVITSCADISPLGIELGAVNTLIPIEKDGWLGTNTDSEGFVKSLEKEKLKNKKSIVLGCGGSARAVLAGLQSLKVSEITIIGRNIKKLNNLTKEIMRINGQKLNHNTLIRGLDEKQQELKDYIHEADLIINTTPVGMQKESGENNEEEYLPFGSELWNHLTKETILYDLIYTPSETPWLQLGGKIGCTNFNGLEMLIQQGAASLRLWTGETNIPINVMREATKKQLKN